MPSPIAAVIDIGSNSIKILIAQRQQDGQLESLAGHTLDARISTGISHAHPRLGEEGMQRGLDAIRELLCHASAVAAGKVVLVATSAVRDAVNGAEFCRRVRESTGHSIRVLSGDEEANLIGRGLTCDPTLQGLENFHVFDLGGGSLECLGFEHRRIAQVASLKLGCVRLTEQFVPDPASPFSHAQRIALKTHVTTTLHLAGFHFFGSERAAIFAGGSMTTVRAIHGAREGRRMEDEPALVTVEAIQTLLDEISAMSLSERQLIPGLPRGRADVFPAALATMMAIAEAGRLTCFHHSLYNLRWGIADEVLPAKAG